MQTSSHEQISARAYQLWEEEGRPHGRDIEHWSRAAGELAGVTAAPATTSAALEVKAPAKRARAKAAATEPAAKRVRRSTK